MEHRRLKSYEFRRERQSSWTELDRLVTRVEKSGIRSLNEKELGRLPILYRAALSSLSVARSISLDRALLDYLEGLCARAYFCVYGATANLGKSIGYFFVHRFPRAVRNCWGPIAMAAAFLVLGLVVATVLTINDPDWFYVFVDEGLANGRNPATPTEELRETLFDRGEGSLAAFASFLFQHNSRVGLLAFTLGFLAGVPVYLLMFATGLMMGAFGALFGMRGLGVEFWGWVLPHGVTEFLAVILCGGAGLVLAQALVFPGRHTRLQNLARRGREAGTIALGCIAMFFVAGMIEGFFRQLVTDTFVRYVVAFTSAILLATYFTLCGRREPA